jgi:uncharacterized protein YebE (UPF0316 family)
MIDVLTPSVRVLGAALLIFGLRVTDVSMGTVRTIMIMRGMRKWAALIGFIEVTIWVVAISQVITHLDNVWSILGYSGGFAVGTLLGMWIEGKLAFGHMDVHIVSKFKGQEIVQNLRRAGYGATQSFAEGQSGPVYLIDVVAPRKQTGAILRLVNEVDATSFVTVEEARQVIGGYQKLAK